jgi:xanthine dehydrogenase accessory factor
VAITLTQGWLIEPLASPTRHLWVWGAGHVGRAVVALIAPLPDWTITWIDHDQGCFAPPYPAGVTCRVAPDPASLGVDAPLGAHHLIMTRSHPLDLAICHGILTHGFATAGLIGSASKAGRFRTRLQALGHTQAQIARICCPIGTPALGKHPQAIAIGVAQELIRPMADGWERAAG